MTNPPRNDIRLHQFNNGDRLLLDANIWLSIRGPVACQNWQTTVYSKALSRMFKARCEIRMDVLVLSEFINRFARLEYNQLPPASKPKTFKNFRDSTAFDPVAQDIAANVRGIAKAVTRCESGFTKLDIADMMKEFEKTHTDFNDDVLCEICRTEGLTFVTHDRDFRDRDIPLLTANKLLLT